MNATSRKFIGNNLGVRAMLVGMGIGDALGAAFEMVPYRTLSTLGDVDILEDYREGVVGSLLEGHQPGAPTDDTAMTISVGRTLIASDGAARRDDFVRGFQRDLVTGNDDVTKWFAKGGPGAATMRALQTCAEGQYMRGADVTDTPGYSQAGGNGTIMRVAPVAALANPAEVVRVAREQAEATHGHPSAVAAAEEVAIRLHRLLRGLPLPGEPITNDFMLMKAWRERVGKGEKPLRDIPKSAWETAAGAWGICVHLNWDPSRILGFAATSGGDTDTMAAVAGAFVGARVGDMRALPGALLHGLISREVLVDLADRLTK